MRKVLSVLVLFFIYGCGGGGSPPDTTSPDSIILGAPLDPTNSTDATFEFSCNENFCDFLCSYDGGMPFACVSPYTFATAIGDGVHTFTVEATDKAGNVEEIPESWTWTVDTELPNTSIDSGPDGPTNQTTAEFTFSGDDENNLTFECMLDSLAWQACISPWTISGLAEGAHAFLVKAIDITGNEDPQPDSRTWTVDTLAPFVTINSSTTDSHHKDASFQFTSNEPATIECKLEGSTGEGTGWESCFNTKDYEDILLGEQTFSVRATDLAGNVSIEESETWTISWFKEEIDNRDNSGHYSAIAVDPLHNENVVILYSFSNSHVWTAEGFAENWNINVEKSGTFDTPYFSIDIDDSGIFHGHFFDSNNLDMKYISGSSVHALGLNTTFVNDVGRFSSTAISPFNGDVWSTYFYNAPGTNCFLWDCNDELRIFRKETASTVDWCRLHEGDHDTDTGKYTSLKIDDQDSKHVAYTHNGGVMYTYGQFVENENEDCFGNFVDLQELGDTVNLDIKQDGTESHIVYLADNNSRLMHAYTTFGDLNSWTIEEIDSGLADHFKPIWGSGVRVEQDSRGYVHVVYVTSDGDLKHATLLPNSLRDDFSARIDVIDTGVADDPSLDMGPDGTLHVSYRKTSGLWYAKIKP